MKIIPTELPGVLLMTPRVFPDSRGFFTETFSARRYAEAGVVGPFVQDNHSRSTMGVVRGLHFQLRRPQGKLVSVLRGAIFDVAVDIRTGSSTFGRWVGVMLSDETHSQLYVPPGFAHGFCVTSDIADVHYKCTDYYEPGDDGGVLWSDPDLAISWPAAVPIVSPKDAQYPRLRDLPPHALPTLIGGSEVRGSGF